MLNHILLWLTNAENLKTVSSILTPLIVAGIGFLISHRLKRMEERHWASRKITEKRLELYEAIAPALNEIFCFYSFLGSWKETSPEAVIALKRRLDKIVYVNEPFLTTDFMSAYGDFIATYFDMFSGHGKDARLRTTSKSINGDRKTHCSYEWKESYDGLFSTDNLPNPEKIGTDYRKALKALKMSISLPFDHS